MGPASMGKLFDDAKIFYIGLPGSLCKLLCFFLSKPRVCYIRTLRIGLSGPRDIWKMDLASTGKLV